MGATPSSPATSQQSSNASSSDTTKIFQGVVEAITLAAKAYNDKSSPSYPTGATSSVNVQRSTSDDQIRHASSATFTGYHRPSSYQVDAPSHVGVPRSATFQTTRLHPNPVDPMMAKTTTGPAAMSQLANRDCLIELCGANLSNQGCSNVNCIRLHLCRFHVLSQCPNSNCTFGHHMRSARNRTALYANGIEHLSDDVIIASLINNRTKYTTPLPCKNYNRPGGVCQKDDDCHFLHICSAFFNENCTKRGQCELSHQIVDRHNRPVLEKYGINVKKPASNILAELRAVGNTGVTSTHDSSLGASSSSSNTASSVSAGSHKPSRSCQVPAPSHTSVPRPAPPRAASSLPSPAVPVKAKIKIDTASMSHDANSECSIELCGANLSPQGCSDADCVRLHLCRFHVLSQCPDDNCVFGHDIRTAHNKKARSANGILHQNVDAITASLIKNRSKHTSPSPCKNYNRPGAVCRKGEDCHFLHVCSDYFSENCTKRGQCDLSHQIIDRHNRHVLEKYGFDMKKPASSILADLRAVVNSGDKNGNDRDVAEQRQPVLQQQRLDSSLGRICIYYLDGKCRYGDNCTSAHFNKPYLWQAITVLGQSRFLISVNDRLEEFFCNPRYDELDVEAPEVVAQLSWSQSLHGKMFPFTVTQQCGNPSLTPVMLMRWSTISCAERPDAPKATEWVWYWQDENNQWIEYGAMSITQMKSNVTSKQIEACFSTTPNGSIQFTTNNGQHYNINFVNMTQTNINYGTVRRVRRRPRMHKSASQTPSTLAENKNVVPVRSVTPAASREHRSRQPSASGATAAVQAELPKNWSPMVSEEVTRELLDRGGPTGKEYNKIQSLFKKTMRQATIIKIERIQNPHLWRQFTTEKRRIENLLGTKDVNNRLLFHGTKEDTVNQICHQNFDWRLVGTNVGFVWGKGSYFAQDASFSNSYATPSRSGRQFMFVANVLLGRSTLGHKDYLRPPAVDQATPEILFDSCVDRMLNPTIFVIFKDQQCYPSYLVEYHNQ